MISRILGFGLPAAASTYAADIDRGIRMLHGTMLAIFVLWSAILAYLLVRYRARPGQAVERDCVPKWWLFLPLALVFLDESLMIARYGIPTWRKIKMELPEPQRSSPVRVVAEQFAWNVHYPGTDGKYGRADVRFVDPTNVLGLDPEDPDGLDDVVALNELHAPLGKPTLVECSSKDVIHSFFVPTFRIKQDCVPGMTIPIWFEPITQGRHELACAQLCGNGHAAMRGEVVVETQEEFDAWLKAQAAPRPRT